MLAQTPGIGLALRAASGSVMWHIPRMGHRTMIDINSGRCDQLKTLVGIGDTYAKRIVEGRPSHCTGELVTRNVIPQANYDRIKERIMTRPQSCH